MAHQCSNCRHISINRYDRMTQFSYGKCPFHNQPGEYVSLHFARECDFFMAGLTASARKNTPNYLAFKAAMQTISNIKLK